MYHCYISKTSGFGLNKACSRIATDSKLPGPKNTPKEQYLETPSATERRTWFRCKNSCKSLGTFVIEEAPTINSAALDGCPRPDMR